MVLGILSMIVIITSIAISFILLIAMPTDPICIIVFGVGVSLGLILLFTYFCIDDNDDYDYGYDDGKKETKNKEKNPFIVKLKTTCPHCGAPMKNDTCDYCGCKSEIYKVLQ